MAEIARKEPFLSPDESEERERRAANVDEQNSGAVRHLPGNRGRVKIENTPKRIRGYLDDKLVVDSSRARSVWEKPYYPTYYFPFEDVEDSVLVATGGSEKSPSRGVGYLYDVRGARRATEGGAYFYPDSPMRELHQLVAFKWGALDHWFEEDEEVFTHARNSYTRIDILPSSRYIRVELDGVTLAETGNAFLLFETGLPTRYYLPRTDVRLDLLTATKTATSCPYKGTARHWSVDVNGKTFEDIVWGYDTPLPESIRVAGLVSFYNEKVDIFVDGERQERPRTLFG